MKNETIKNKTFGFERALYGTKNAVIENCLFEGKEDGESAMKECENIAVVNCRMDLRYPLWHVRGLKVRGGYLAWYSENLTFVRCKIIGTQPLCYCKNLKLIDCTMQDCDLSFEYSDVEADIIGNVLSVKNPRSGRITADSVGEVILTKDSVYPPKAEVRIRNK